MAQFPFYRSPHYGFDTVLIFDEIPFAVFGKKDQNQLKGFANLMAHNLQTEVICLFEQGGKITKMSDEEKMEVRHLAAFYDNVVISGSIGLKLIPTQKQVKVLKSGKEKVSIKPAFKNTTAAIHNVHFEQIGSKVVRVGATQLPKYWENNMTENLFNILAKDIELTRTGKFYHNPDQEIEIPWKEVTSLKELKEFLDLEAYEDHTNLPIAFDIETTGVAPWKKVDLTNSSDPADQIPQDQKILSCSVCLDPEPIDGGGVSFFIHHPDYPEYADEGLKMFKWLMSLPNPKVAHNAKFEYIWTEKYYNIPINGQLRDTQLMNHWLNENMGSATSRYSLAGTIASQLNLVPHKGDFLSKLETGLKQKKKAAKSLTEEDIAELKRLAEDPNLIEFRNKDFTKFNREELHTYGSADAHNTLMAYYKMIDRLEALDQRRKAETGVDKNSAYYLFHLQDRMTRSLGTMEYNGMFCDTDFVSEIMTKCDAAVAESTEILSKLTGDKEVNFSSPKEVSEFIKKTFPDLYLSLEVNKKGDLTLDKAALKNLKEEYPWLEHYETYKHAYKAKGTYLVPFYKFSTNRRLHFNFNIHGTATGRLSSDKPNMQNIPKKIMGIPIKSVLKPEKGQVLYNLDLATAEVRMLANYTRDPNLIEALNSGLDTHSYTASRIPVCPYSYEDIINARKRDKDVTVELTAEDNDALKWRQIAKTVTFGTIYGMTFKALANDLDLEPEEAQGILDGFFVAYPEVEKWIWQVRETAYKLGYVETIFTRRRNFAIIRLIDQYFAGKGGYHMKERMYRQAVNYLIQGTTSDYFQMLIYDINQIPGVTPHITVHDSVVFSLDETKTSLVELYKECDRILIERPKEIFGSFLEVPLLYDLARGNDYGDMQELDKKRIMSGELFVETPNGELKEKSEPAKPVFKKRLLKRPLNKKKLVRKI